ncbi:hypothetical protein HDU81_008554 [Chytriomyces hyalinus]|nr:hypothetical protein HDU81_008554 [Chytriomyces hyalinus]
MNQESFVIADAAAPAGSDTGPPDGGFDAWMSVVGSFIIHIVSVGILYSFGVFGAHYVATGVDQVSVISMIGSVATASMMAPGVLTGRLAERIGFTITVMIGAVVMGVSLLLASYASTSWQLLLTQGVLFGLGASLSYIPVLALPAHWFGKKKSIANGIGVAGGGIGGIVISLVVQRLIAVLGVRTALQITAGCVSACALIVSPFVKARVKSKSQGTKFDWTVCKTQRFNLHLGSVFFNMFPCFIPAFFLPLVARDVVGLSASDGAALVAIFNASSAVGRVSVGVIADLIFGRANSMIVCNFLNACSCFFVWTFARSFSALAAFAVLNGFTAGGFWSLLPVLVSHSFELKRLPSILGMMLSVSSIGFLCGPPLAGLMYDRLGYMGVTFFAGGLNLIAMLFAVALKLSFEPKWMKAV